MDSAAKVQSPVKPSTDGVRLRPEKQRFYFFCGTRTDIKISITAELSSSAGTLLLGTNQFFSEVLEVLVFNLCTSSRLPMDYTELPLSQLGSLEVLSLVLYI